MSEKTEKPTANKLQKARELGQVSKSNDLITILHLLVMLGVTTALWPNLLTELQTFLRHLFQLIAHFKFNLDQINKLQQLILNKLLNLWLPFALAGILAIILGSIGQTGFIWSSKPLVPDFKRLNFIQGFKKLFSMKTCFEALKNSIKLSTILIFLFFTLKHQLSSAIQLSLITPGQVPVIMMHMLLKTLFQLILILSVFACIDFFYTRWKYQKDQRMSKQELKDEYKQREGDPKIKAKIKQIQNQLRQKTASLKQVKTANVIITNPTHIAIALKYERGLMPAPKVVCKAQDEMVNQVKTIARTYGIPIIENKVLARALYQTIELNQWISRDLFPMTAEIFRELYKQRKEA